jgi:hypothetical protein
MVRRRYAHDDAAPTQNDMALDAGAEETPAASHAIIGCRIPALSEHELSGRSPSPKPEDANTRNEIGNHTATHVRCRSLSADEHVPQIVDARRRLELMSRSRAPFV